MSTITLATRRPFNWRVYLVLLALLGLASLAAIPHVLMPALVAREEAGLLVPLLLAVAIVALASLPLGALLGGIGLLLAGRTGLGLPFIEGWAKKEPIWDRCRGTLVLSVVIGVVASLVGVGLDEWVFAPLLEAELHRLGSTLSERAVSPVWQWPTIVVTAPIWEEVAFRLFGLTFLAWLIGRINHDKEGRPTPLVFWAANALTAVAFGLDHLMQATPISGSLTLIVIRVTQAMTCQGACGLALGWLYWKRGLESAMLAHSAINVTAIIVVEPLLRSGGL